MEDKGLEESYSVYNILLIYKEVIKFKTPSMVIMNKKYLALILDEDLEEVFELVRLVETLQ